MNAPTLSVAMCTHNGAGYLREQLASIAAQHRLPTELVICDDVSTDGTLEILAAFRRDASFTVKVVRNASRLGSTRNFDQALRLCAGEIIAFSDQDDVWRPDKLAALEDALVSGAGVALSNAEIVDSGGRPLGYDLWTSAGFSNRRRARVQRGEAFEVLLGCNFAYGNTMAFWSKFRDAVLPIPACWGHDMWTALIIASQAPVALVPQMLIKYRQHRGQQVANRATRRGLLERARQSVSIDADDCTYETLLYSLAHERLVSAPNLSLEARIRALQCLNSKTGHLLTRARIRARAHPQRVAMAFFELATFRYHRYSSGFLSAIRDIYG